MPTLKEKKRYIGFEVVGERKFKEVEVSAAFDRGIKEYLGDFGAARAGAFLVKGCFSEGRGIARVSNGYVEHAKAAMAMIDSVGGSRAIFKTISVSGTLKKLKLRVYGEAA